MVALLSFGETDSHNFELEYKKIAFRDIDSVEFYHKEDDQYKRFVSMSSYIWICLLTSLKIKSKWIQNSPTSSGISNERKISEAVYKVNDPSTTFAQESETGYKSGLTSASVRQSQVSKMSTLKLCWIGRRYEAKYGRKLCSGADLDASEVNLADMSTSKGTSPVVWQSSQNGKLNIRFNLAKPLLKPQWFCYFQYRP